MLDSALAAALGIGVLYMFYRAVELEWPSSYLTLDNGVGYALTSHPLRYVAFRFLPIYLICLFIAVSLDRAHTVAWPAVLATCLVHAALHNGLALVTLRRSHPAERRGPLTLLHMVVIIGIVGAGATALATRGELAGLIPKLTALAAALWTSALAGVVGAFLIATSRTDRSRSTVLGQSRRRIPRELWDAAEADATAVAADPLLFKAVMIVENASRPAWFRRLERWKGQLFEHGTYGIMQIEVDRPVSDRESIRIAAQTRFASRVVPRDAYGSPDWEAPRRFALEYNPDSTYADAVAEAYSTLWAERFGNVDPRTL